MLILRIFVGLVLAYVVLVILAWRFQERLAFPAPLAPLRSRDVGGRASSRGRRDPRIPVHQRGRDGAPALCRVAALYPAPVARQPWSHAADPLPGAGAARRRRPSRADGDGEGRRGGRGGTGTGRAGPDPWRWAQRDIRSGWSPVSGQALGVRCGTRR